MRSPLSNRNFGTDPEFPITNIYKRGLNNLAYVIPPESLIEDNHVRFTEENNKKVLYKGVTTDNINYKFIEDGAALELNIQPISSLIYFKSSVQFALEDMRRFVRQINSNYTVKHDSVGFFDLEEFWNKRGDNFRECVIFGCDPDTIPYIYKEMKLINIDNSEEIDATNHNLRYFGGHLHVQNMSNDKDLYIKSFDYVAVVFDFLVGLTNASFRREEKHKNNELLRLKYYGHPGRARIQYYSDEVNGYEYRPLSNYWLMNGSSIDKILCSADLACFIIENNLAELFFKNFEEYIPAMYKANLELDREKSVQLLLNVYKWLIKEDIVPLSHITTIGDNIIPTGY